MGEQDKNKKISISPASRICNTPGGRFTQIALASERIMLP